MHLVQNHRLVANENLHRGGFSGVTRECLQLGVRRHVQIRGAQRLRTKRDEFGAQPVRTGAVVPLEHAFVHERAEQTKRRRLVQPDMPRQVGDRPMRMLRIKRLEDDERAMNRLRSRIRCECAACHARYRPIAARYERSHAAGMDSSGENGPG